MCIRDRCKPARSGLFPLAHLPTVGTGRTLCVGPPLATDMECVAVSILIETDGRSRAVIPGHMNQRFLLQDNAVLDACELIFRLPAQAQARSTAIMTAEGIRLRLPVAGHPPYKVFWSSGSGQPAASKSYSQAPRILVVRPLGF